MSETDDRTVALLEQIVELQKQAAERQQRVLEITMQNYADARKRAEVSVDLQRLAVNRQRLFLRVWYGLIAIIVFGVGWLVYSAFYRFH